MTFAMKTGRTIKSALVAGALGSAMLLSACGGEAEAPVEEVEGKIPGMTVENARMALNAVEGNPAAVYFDLAYDADRALSISRASVEGAESAVIHQYGEYDFKVQMMEALPVPLKKGDKVEFKPGDLHVMAMGVSPDLKPGGKAEVTIIVSGGDSHTFEADILAAGDPAIEGAGEES